MRNRSSLTQATIFACYVATASLSYAESVDYLREIKPVLTSRCYSCHGALKQESGLRLDTGEFIRTGSNNGPIAVAGQVDASTLVERITASDEAERMPPEGEPLTNEQIARIKRWIADGIRSPDDERPEEDPRDHWAFQTPQRAELPNVRNAAWARNPIDAFIAAAHERSGLAPLPAASRAILLRRVYLDLIGLPPTREELHSFLADDSPEAYAKIVERLLDSEHYGERWGRHWMDVWRYSDWYGRRQVGDVRNSYPHIWRWRDWIIQSLNNDKGYDQMVREMLAADELYPTDDSRIPALGFIVRNWFSLNYDTWKQDLVEHTGKAFLGLRINCAHCHDHKYDPISQKEYFAFRAFFEPLEFRHDRVPGGPALAKYIRYGAGSGASLKPIAAGLPRVYDLYHDEKTFMYRLGDTRDRFERPPVEPDALAVLGRAPLAIEPVDLPPTAWYPGLKPFVHEEEAASRRKAIQEAEAALVKATATFEPLAGQLAEADVELAEAKKKAGNVAAPEPRSIDHVIAWWRFEGTDNETGFLADSSGNGHTLQRITGEETTAKPLTLAQTGTTRAFLPQLPGEDLANQQAAEFQQNRSFAFLAASGNEQFYANTFALEAFVHFDVSQRNYNRTIADYQGSWTLLHRGIDDKTFELRVRYFNDQGQLRDVATSHDAANLGEPLILQTGHDYYVCLVMSEHAVVFHAANLTLRTPLQALQLPRNSNRHDFAKLARPPAETRFKIGNSDGTGRVDGLIDEVRYTRGGLKGTQIAAAVGQSSNTAVQQAAMKASGLRRKMEPARLATVATRLKLEAAQADLKALAARIKADRAKFEAETDDDDAEGLAKVAAETEHAAKALASRAKLAQANQLLAAYKVTASPDQKKVKQAEQDITAAKKALADLQQAPGDSSDYTPLGPQYPKTSTGRRAALANWITDNDNPLTARVAVNHIWMRHFGRPLVESVFDFGRSGKKPTLPQLLDWLAVELMEHNWSMKHIHRLIVTSNTYQLDSRPGSANHPNFAIDKDNRLWWKCDRRRLEAEVIRDSMLAASGQLDRTIGGPEIAATSEASSLRRSLYFTIYPEAGGAMQFMTLFDPPDPGGCYRRTDSIVPQQALAMSNSRLAINQGRLLAGAMVKKLASADNVDDDFVIGLFEQVLSRQPTKEEAQVCREFLAKQRELYELADLEELAAAAPKGWVAPAQDAGQRARESLARTLLNHNDFITIH